MKIIYNNIIPFDGFKAIVIGPCIFARNGCKIDDTCIRHERIHWEQQKELVIIGFYLLYLLIWLWEIMRCAFNRSRGMYSANRRLNIFMRAYYSIALEREAYRHQNEKDYISLRRHYAWAK